MIFTTIEQLNQALVTSGRIMALDVGTKRIGIAISDESRLIANPRLILNRQSNQKDFTKIKEFIDENQIVAIAIGLPLDMNGNESEMSIFIKKFSENFNEFLAKKTPILLFDERLSSFKAREISNSVLSRKKKCCDDIAASVILQDILDVLSTN